MRSREFIAEGGAETSWSDGNEKITLQDILELTKHVRPINLAINDNLKSKLIHWDGNPEEIERINQVTISNQFPILIIVDEQGDIQFILDGNHRLHKAIRAQAKTIPAKLIKPSDLSDKAKKIFHIQEQGVAEGLFNKCFDKACKLYDKAVEKDLNPILYQVADYKGDGSNADSRWTKLPQHVWNHYVTVIGDTVYDPTAKQFGSDKSEKYHVKQLEKEWGNIYKIRPKQQDVAEAPLPPDWDPEKINLQQRFADRIKYVVDRARRIGGGSARVAFEIDYQGRPTVIKVAKNAKGLLQNAAEISILRDADTGGMPIAIPLIDFDQSNAQPVWIQTEMAKRVRSDTLVKLLRAPNLWLLIDCVEILLGRVQHYRKYNNLPEVKKQYFESMWHKNNPPTEQGWQIFLTYAKELAELASKTTIEIWDLNSPSNWGVFNNRPVVLDLGFTTEVWQAIRDQT